MEKLNMVFSSVIFLFYFLPIVLISCFLAKKIEVRNIILLVLSLIFYMWGGIATFPLIIISILINYIFGILIESYYDNKKLWLWTAVILNLGLLFYFKYSFFFVDKIYNTIAHKVNILPSFDIAEVALPIGISFFTFQGLSYVIDVYRGTVKAQRNILKLAMYISLFPQLVAGPIVRYSSLEAELTHRTISADDIVLGIKRFIIGLCKKVIIADILAETVDSIFNIEANALTVSLAWVGAISYTLQIYYDFSGYSDMAIGLGKILGFTFPENFNLPYISKSINEFWRRWHITLGSWFRDYLYIPLGGE